ISAASETLASNVYYINSEYGGPRSGKSLTQPSAMERALPNIKEIYAMRALGVYSQCQGWNVPVSSSGCDLSTLGNGARDFELALEKTMLSIDQATGIFVRANYNSGSLPSLTASVLSSSDSNYQNIQKGMNLDTGKIAQVYYLSAVGSPSGKYTLYLPTAARYKDSDLELYHFATDGTVTKLTTQRTDNILSAETSTMGYYVLVDTTPETAATATSSQTTSTNQGPVQGKTYKVSGYKYKVTSLSKKTVTVTGVTKKSLKSIKVKNTVKILGTTFKVTAVGKRAFAKCKKAKKAVIGTKVKTIGKKAFFKDNKLKKITVKTKVLKKVGAKALKGIYKKAVIKVPAAKLKKYKKLFKGKGQSSKVKIKK
ncbi:MAG: leucine-rich repeat protein, partial [Eubacterium sp.]|nr:leucine-rich repeat protein [Eubacterium sp.]